jgi:hypothetical protein
MFVLLNIGSGLRMNQVTYPFACYLSVENERYYYYYFYVMLKEYQLYGGNPFLGIRWVVSRPRPDMESVVGPVERRQLRAHVHPLLAQLPPLVSHSVTKPYGIPRIFRYSKKGRIPDQMTIRFV